MCSVYHMLCFFVFQFQRHGDRGVGQRTKIEYGTKTQKESIGLKFIHIPSLPFSNRTPRYARA